MDYESSSLPWEWAPTVKIPADHICIPIKDYDALQARLNSLKEDFHIELAGQAKELNWQKAIVESRDREIDMLKQDLADSEKREKDLAMKLFQANETILSLRSEIHLLNDELCRSDEIWNGDTNAIPEDKTNSL